MIKENKLDDIEFEKDVFVCFVTFALLAFLAGRVVLAVAGHLAGLGIPGAVGGVAVALASASYGQIGDSDPPLLGLKVLLVVLKIVGVVFKGLFLLFNDT